MYSGWRLLLVEMRNLNIERYHLYIQRTSLDVLESLSLFLSSRSSLIPLNSFRPYHVSTSPLNTRPRRVCTNSLDFLNRTERTMPLFPFFFFFFFFFCFASNAKPPLDPTPREPNRSEALTNSKPRSKRFARDSYGFVVSLGENLIYDKSEYERRWITFVSNPDDDDCRLLLAAVHQAGN